MTELLAILSNALLIFLVIDPLGNLPVFSAVLAETPPQRQRRVLLRELLIALAVLAVFLLAGRHILLLMHVTESSLGVAGGVVLMIIALRMIFRGGAEVFPSDTHGEPFIVPLAIPLVAGPGAITVVMLLAGQADGGPLAVAPALLLAWAVGGLILLASTHVARALGRRGLAAAERLTGMLLTIVAVEMILSGVRKAALL